MISVTDHNTSAHVPLVSRLAETCGVTVVPGMEVTTREEVHVLAYFAELAGLEEFQQAVDNALPQAENDTEHFGWQVIYDADDEIVDVDGRLRQMGTSLGLEEVVERVHAAGGVAVPAHVYRTRNSLTSQLGFINPDDSYDALEVSVRSWRQRDLRLGDVIAGFPAIAGSDAHFVEDIGRFALDAPATVRNVPQLLGALLSLDKA
jgi:predicted metal-dependent phosphoesterase TrpH